MENAHFHLDKVSDGLKCDMKLQEVSQQRDTPGASPVNSPALPLGYAVTCFMPSSSSNFIPNRKQSTAYMSKDTSVNQYTLMFCWWSPEKPKAYLARNQNSKRVAAIGCPPVQRTRYMDSWTPGSDPRNPPAGTDCTSGPGNHRPWERTHWSITRCRYALTTGSHKARPESPTHRRAPTSPSQGFRGCVHCTNGQPNTPES